MAELTEFSVGQGETFKILVTIANDSGSTPLDITNYTITGQIRENYTTDEISATFSAEKLLPTTSGSFFISLSSNDTLALSQRKYVYDIYISSGSVQPINRRILEGLLTVRPAVTR
jgi:hypothetical protein